MRFQRLGDRGGEIPVVLDENGAARDLRTLTTDIDGPFLAADGIARTRVALAEGALPVLDIAHIVWYLSQFMVLEPGDVVNTGTPAGVAFGANDFPYLSAGDEVTVAIDGLGSQCHRIGRA